MKSSVHSTTARPGTAPLLLSLATILALALSTGGCSDPAAPVEETTYEFVFNAGGHGFAGSFSDVAVAEADNVGFESGHRGLPGPLDGGALYHSGLNVSDDLFMFFARRVDGLEPGAPYTATFEVEIATDYGEDCAIGVGAGVLVKAGAAGEEVRRVVVVENNQDGYRLSVDKGEQSNDGPAAVILGDIRNGLPGCDETVPYARETVAMAGKEVTFTADGEGGAWLFFGTESTFESRHEVYFTRFRAELR